VIRDDYELLAVPDGQTLASSPNSSLKMPMVPGPQTSCVTSTSTSTQTFSPGWRLARSDARARIFSVIVIALFTCGGHTQAARVGPPAANTISTKFRIQQPYRDGVRRRTRGRGDGAYAAWLVPAALARAVLRRSRRRRGERLLRQGKRGGEDH
jgi:hypothetical protein